MKTLNSYVYNARPHYSRYSAQPHFTSTGIATVLVQIRVQFLKPFA